MNGGKEHTDRGMQVRCRKGRFDLDSLYPVELISPDYLTCPHHDIPTKRKKGTSQTDHGISFNGKKNTQKLKSIDLQAKGNIPSSLFLRSRNRTGDSSEVSTLSVTNGVTVSVGVVVVVLVSEALLVAASSVGDDVVASTTRRSGSLSVSGAVLGGGTLSCA